MGWRRLPLTAEDTRRYEAVQLLDLVKSRRHLACPFLPVQGDRICPLRPAVQPLGDEIKPENIFALLLVQSF